MHPPSKKGRYGFRPGNPGPRIYNDRPKTCKSWDCRFEGGPDYIKRMVPAGDEEETVSVEDILPLIEKIVI